MQSERGAMAANILTVLLIITVCGLVYVLWHAHNKPAKNQVDYADAIGAGYTKPAPQNTHATRKSDPTPAVFSDGLPTVADDAIKYELNEFGEGVESIDVFFHDLNNDGIPDRITRTHIENGTDHYTDKYKIELHSDNGFVDITPPDFQTIEGADCSLQKIQFDFNTPFRVIKIARPWQETWDTPTMATRTIYTLKNGQLVSGNPVRAGTVCDVAELF